MNHDTLSPFRLFPSLRLGRYRFVLKPNGPISLPAYQGSTWRGVLGNALLDVVCPWDKKECATCPNRDSCAYHCLYEAGLEEKGFANLPRPYIISPINRKDRELSVEMTLVGDVGAFLPHLIAAWIRAGERGAGKGRGRFSLESVHKLLPNGKSEVVYSAVDVAPHQDATFQIEAYLTEKICDPPWTIIIETPLRLRRNGVNSQAIDWSKAFKSLAIRLSVLGQRYCHGSRPSKSAWAELMLFLDRPGHFENHTRWFDWNRFSSKQRRHVPMGGLVGKSVIRSVDNASLWWEWWQTASLFHMGKGISMGLGRLRIGDFVG